MSLTQDQRRNAEKIVDLAPVSKDDEKALVYFVSCRLMEHSYFKKYPLTSYWLTDPYSLTQYLDAEKKIPKTIEAIISAVYLRTHKIIDFQEQSRDVDDALNEIAERWLL